MTAQTKTKAEAPTGLALLREPFPANQIAKLPKPTERQTNEVKQDFKKGIRCKDCGQWHHPQVVHLDYVGHAALTDRLLDADPMWNWEPVAVNEDGTPKMDQIGGMWIRLTVCNMTRLGYGDAQGKKGPNAVKEVIGDALRNAAMRFGAALDLWHKGDLHGDVDPVEDKTEDKTDDTPVDDGPKQPTEAEIAKGIIEDVDAARGDKAELTRLWKNYRSVMAGMSDNNFDAVKKAFVAAAPKAEPTQHDNEAPF